MPNIKLDDVILSSFHEAFRNRERQTASIVLSGVIPNGHKAFSVDVPIIRDSAVYEIYSKVDTGNKRPVSNGQILIDVVWAHNIYIWAHNPSPNTLRLTIDVDNPGLATAITTQTVSFTIYVFDTPFS